MSTDELEKQGWVKRTTIDEPRLSEIIEEYESLGFEVHLEPVKLEDLDEKCRSCYVNNVDRIKTVYVRKRK
jgi:NifB/MoaA-like Fe-S oxidoreductase